MNRSKQAGMARKTMVVLLIGLALASVGLAEAQQQRKVPKIGWLVPRINYRFEEFLREFRKLGYVDGKNVSFETRVFGSEFDRLPALAEDLVGLKVDVIVTRGTPETLALKKATKTIPIVFYSVTDPVGAGLVDSLARPGGNITGFTSIEAVLAGKRLRITQGNLAQTLPCRGAVESSGPQLCATVERKPIASTGTRIATSFHGSEQLRQIRKRVQSGG
jgi:ABC-type uncharacterized transport system substrate-binding protein